MDYKNLKPEVVQGANFKAKKTTYFRGTSMSVAMAAAGIIPAPHLIRENAVEAVVRNKHDNLNQRPSARIAL